MMITEPKIKSDLKQKLRVGDLIEGIYYRIEEIKDERFLVGNEPPKVGEILSIHYDFKKSSVYYGYEHLYFLIGRQEGNKIHNYVRYFNSIEDMEIALQYVVLKKDDSIPRHMIKQMQKKIDKLKKDYEI